MRAAARRRPDATANACTQTVSTTGFGPAGKTAGPADLQAVSASNGAAGATAELGAGRQSGLRGSDRIDTGRADLSRSAVFEVVRRGTRAEILPLRIDRVVCG